MKLGLGSYSYRWSIGHKDRIPSSPITCIELLRITSKLDLDVLQIADNMPVHNIETQTLDQLYRTAQKQGINLEIGMQSFSTAVSYTHLTLPTKRIV